MTITYGVVNNSATAATGATSFTTASTTTQNGDTFLIFAPADYPLTGVSDNKGNTYTLLAQVASGLHRVYIASGATTGGAGHTFSSAYSSTSWASLFGIWIRGAGSYDAGSINANNRGGAGPWWTGDVTLANANNLLLSFVGMFAGTAASTFSWATFGTGPAPSVAGQLSDSSAYSPGGILASQGTFSLTGTKYSIDITLSSSSSGADIITVAFPDTGGGGTNVALTGNSVAGTVGTVLPVMSKALTGNSATATPGTVTAAVSKALTGNTGTLSPGSVSPVAAAALSAVSSAASAGTPTANLAVPITGVTGTLSVGSVSYTSGTSAQLSGVTATASSGSVAPSITVALTGVSASASVGSLVYTRSAALSGVSAALSVGNLAPVSTVALAGVSGIVTPGNVAFLSNDITIQLTGVTVGVSVGSVTPQGTTPVGPKFEMEVDPIGPSTSRKPRRLLERSIQPILQKMLERKLQRVKPQKERAAARAKRIEFEAAALVLAGATEREVRSKLLEWEAQRPYIPPALAEIPPLDIFMSQVGFRIEQAQAVADLQARQQARDREDRQDEDALMAIMLALNQGI